MRGGGGMGGQFRGEAGFAGGGLVSRGDWFRGGFAGRLVSRWFRGEAGKLVFCYPW